MIILASCFLPLALAATASAEGLHRGPEIDVGVAAAGIALLAGGVMLIIERFRRR